MSALKSLKTEFLEYLEIEKGRSINTIAHYDRYLERFLTFAQVDEPLAITDELVRSFRLWLSRQKAGGRDRRRTLNKKTQNYYVIGAPLVPQVPREARHQNTSAGSD